LNHWLNDGCIHPILPNASAVWDFPSPARNTIENIGFLFGENEDGTKKTAPTNIGAVSGNNLQVCFYALIGPVECPSSKSLNYSTISFCMDLP
jgi:hypothetical protein